MRPFSFLVNSMIHTAMPNVKTLRLTTLAATLAATLPALAQQPPDAGRTLQETAPSLETPRPSPGIDVEQPATAPTLPGGTRVVLQSVSFSGNMIFGEADLQAVVSDAVGKSFDFAGLRYLADRISDFYRRSGYRFARAYLPPQPLDDGRLRIGIVEGKYGQVQAKGDAGLAARARPFLAPLKSGQMIESSALERATLILHDQPGIVTTPIIRPGQEIGTGDLDVRVERTPAVKGDIRVDNHGNRYTGQNRLRGNVLWDSPFMLGDQITARMLYTDENLWLGSLGYSLPLNYSGLRGNIGYAHTYYQLAKEFVNLDATGTADVTSLGLTYPIVRSQFSNLAIGATYQHKKLNDRQGVVGTSNDKSSDSLPIMLQFDRRDSLGGGGITYGSLGYTFCLLKLDSTLVAADIASNRDTRGNFDKWNLDIARVQALPAGLTLFGRVSAQWVGKNLDSSESFSLGGPDGVRAYPTGEGNGDEGWLTQIELRYAMDTFSPYGFYDAGRVNINAKPGGITPAVTNNHRSIAGAGIGLRYQQRNWNLDASAAWRTHGGQPDSDTADRNPRFWMTAGYKF